MVYCDARAEKQGKRLPLFIPPPPQKKTKTFDLFSTRMVLLLKIIRPQPRLD